MFVYIAREEKSVQKMLFNSYDPDWIEKSENANQANQL